MDTARHTQKTIFHAATIEFGKHGFQGAKMVDIARQARVSQSSVYYHFKTRKNLYRLVLKSNLQHMIDYLYYHMIVMHVAKRGEDKMIRVFIQYCEGHTEVLRLLILEIHQGGDLLFDLLDDIKETESYEKLYNVTTIFEEYVGIPWEDDSEIIQRFISFIGIIMIQFLLEPLLTGILGLVVTPDFQCEMHELFRLNKKG